MSKVVKITFTTSKIGRIKCWQNKMCEFFFCFAVGSSDGQSYSLCFPHSPIKLWTSKSEKGGNFIEKAKLRRRRRGKAADKHMRERGICCAQTFVIWIWNSRLRWQKSGLVGYRSGLTIDRSWVQIFTLIQHYIVGNGIKAMQGKGRNPISFMIDYR